MSGDLHIIATANGVFVTRSIRRHAVPFNLSRLGDIENWPWEFGYAALGNRLVYNKRVTQPLAFGVGAALPPQIDVEAIQVEQYAIAHPHEDLEDETEAGEVAKQSAPVEAPAVPEAAVEATSSSVGGDVSDVHGQKRADETGDDESHKRVKFADAGFSLLEESFLLDDSDVGRQAPKTPKLDDDEYKRRLSQVTSTDLSLYEHEDQPVSVSLEDDDIERLEDYEFTFGDDEFYDDSVCTDEEALKQLTFPYGKHEPVLDENELQRLDALADGLEIKRLTGMGVLTDSATMPANCKILSTRFVRTWREKLNSVGEQIWLRRSRFVAREFSWMESERDSLFSPASSSIVARLLPSMFLEMREHSSAVMVGIDVKDAFLTVKQETPTVVNCQLADGSSMSYGLGRVLPGQRDGSLLWHRDITKLLRDELGMSPHVPYPCILKSKDNSCYVLIHVDDILVVGKRDFVLQKLLKCLQGKYEVSTQVMEKPGDEVAFLKRRMVLQHDSPLTIQTHHKHVDQMCSLLGLNRKLQGKKSPGHADMDQLDTSGELSPEMAKVFRTCIGILLYLASDLPHCQHVVRHLATYSTQPTVKSLTVLKHLVSYLSAREDVCISLKWRSRNVGVFHSYPNAEPGAMNPADIGTKRLPANRLRSLMSLLGMYNMSTGAIEGAEDPGRVFQKKHHVMTILSVLGLLQMKGCEEDSNDVSPGASLGLMAFTAVLGFLFLMVWLCACGRRRRAPNVEEPDAEPAAYGEPTAFDEAAVWEGEHTALEDHVTEASQMPSSSTDRPRAIEPTVEGS
eukprot:s1770_g4.t1